MKRKKEPIVLRRRYGTPFQHRRQIEDASQIYWNAVADKDIIRQYAHWREYYGGGEKKWLHTAWSNALIFGWALGILRNKHIKNTILRDGNLKLGNMLDWGVGGGMNLMYTANHFDRIYGVDIAPKTLEECQANLKRFGYKAEFCPVLIEASSPESVIKKIPLESIDYVQCISVIQHLPHKHYVRNMLMFMNLLMKPGALALIQVRWYDGSGYYRTKIKDYCKGKNAIRFLSFEFDEFTEMASGVGLEALEEPKLGRANYAFYPLRKNRPVATISGGLT